jgi:hypothetical protein
MSKGDQSLQITVPQRIVIHLTQRIVIYLTVEVKQTTGCFLLRPPAR